MRLVKFDNFFEMLYATVRFVVNIRKYLPRGAASIFILLFNAFNDPTIFCQQRQSARIFNENNQTQRFRHLNDALQISATNPLLQKLNYLEWEYNIHT